MTDAEFLDLLKYVRETFEQLPTFGDDVRTPMLNWPQQEIAALADGAKERGYDRVPLETEWKFGDTSLGDRFSFTVRPPSGPECQGKVLRTPVGPGIPPIRSPYTSDDKSNIVQKLRQWERAVAIARLQEEIRTADQDTPPLPDPAKILNLQDPKWLTAFDVRLTDAWSKSYQQECGRRAAARELVETMGGIEDAVRAAMSNVAPAKQLLELVDTTAEAIAYVRGNGGPQQIEALTPPHVSVNDAKLVEPFSRKGPPRAHPTDLDRVIAALIGPGRLPKARRVLEQLRKDWNLTDRAIAKKLGVSPTIVGLWRKKVSQATGWSGSRDDKSQREGRMLNRGRTVDPSELGNTPE